MRYCLFLLLVFPLALTAQYNFSFRWISIPNTPANCAFFDETDSLSLISLLNKLSDQNIEVDASWWGKSHWYATDSEEPYPFLSPPGAELRGLKTNRQSNNPLTNQYGDDSLVYLPDGTMEFVYPPIDYIYYSTRNLQEIRFMQECVYPPNGLESATLGFSLYGEKPTRDRPTETEPLPFTDLHKLKMDFHSAAWLRQLENETYEGFQYAQSSVWPDTESSWMWQKTDPKSWKYTWTSFPRDSLWAVGTDSLFPTLLKAVLSQRLPVYIEDFNPPQTTLIPLDTSLQRSGGTSSDAAEVLWTYGRQQYYPLMNKDGEDSVVVLPDGTMTYAYEWPPKVLHALSDFWLIVLKEAWTNGVSQPDAIGFQDENGGNFWLKIADLKAIYGDAWDAQPWYKALVERQRTCYQYRQSQQDHSAK